MRVLHGSADAGSLVQHTGLLPRASNPGAADRRRNASEYAVRANLSEDQGAQTDRAARQLLWLIQPSFSIKLAGTK